MSNRITPNLMKEVEQALQEMREKYNIPANLRLLLYDSDMPLDTLIEKLREHYPKKG